MDQLNTIGCEWPTLHTFTGTFCCCWAFLSMLCSTSSLPQNDAQLWPAVSSDLFILKAKQVRGEPGDE